MQVTPTQHRTERSHGQARTLRARQTLVQRQSTNTFHSSKPWDQGVCMKGVVGDGERVGAESCGEQSSGKVHRQRRDKAAS